MAGHAHYDLEAFERNARAVMAQTMATAALAVAEGRAEQDFVSAQEEFAEARVQCALACARASNSGTPKEKIVAAAGIAIGGMIGSLFSSFSAAEQDQFWSWAEMSLEGMESENPDPENHTGLLKATARPMAGGTA